MFRNSTMTEPEGEIDERAVRHNIKKFLIIYLACVIGGGIVGAVLGAVLPHHHRRPTHHHSSAVAAVLGIVIVLVILGVAVATLYWIFHRRSYRRVMQYSLSRRRRVFRALRRGRPLSPEDRPVADAMMYLNRNWRRNLLIVFPLLILIIALDGLAHHGAARWYWIGLAVVYVFLIPYALWNQHRVERNYHRFVRSGPPPEPTG